VVSVPYRNEIYITDRFCFINYGYGSGYGNTCPNPGSVSVVNTTSNTMTDLIPLSGGAGLPVGIAYAPSNKEIYVANSAGGATAQLTFSEGNISVISTQTHNVIANIPINVNPLNPPTDVVYAPSNHDIYVANGTNIGVIDTSTNKVVAMIRGPDMFPGLGTGLVFAPSNNDIYVSGFDILGGLPQGNSGDVSIIDTGKNSIITTLHITNTTISPFGITFAPSNNEVYLVTYAGERYSVVAIDTATNTVVARIPLPGSFNSKSGGMVFDPSNGDMYVTGNEKCDQNVYLVTCDMLYIIDTFTNTIVSSVTVSKCLNMISFTHWANNCYYSWLNDLAYSPRTNNIYVATFTDICCGPNTSIETHFYNYTLTVVSARGTLVGLDNAPPINQEIALPQYTDANGINNGCCPAAAASAISAATGNGHTGSEPSDSLAQDAIALGLLMDTTPAGTGDLPNRQAVEDTLSEVTNPPFTVQLVVPSRQLIFDDLAEGETLIGLIGWLAPDGSVYAGHCVVIQQANTTLNSDGSSNMMVMDPGYGQNFVDQIPAGTTVNGYLGFIPAGQRAIRPNGPRLGQIERMIEISPLPSSLPAKSTTVSGQTVVRGVSQFVITGTITGSVVVNETNITGTTGTVYFVQGGLVYGLANGTVIIPPSVTLTPAGQLGYMNYVVMEPSVLRKEPLESPTDFSLVVSPSSEDLNPGTMGKSTVKLTWLTGIPGPVDLGIAISPAIGLSCSLVSTRISVNSNSTALSCSGSSGSYNVTITGSMGALSHSARVHFSFISPTPVQPLRILGILPVLFFGAIAGFVMIIVIAVLVYKVRRPTR